MKLTEAIERILELEAEGASTTLPDHGEEDRDREFCMLLGGYAKELCTMALSSLKAPEDGEAPKMDDLSRQVYRLRDILRTFWLLATDGVFHDGDRVMSLRRNSPTVQAMDEYFDEHPWNAPDTVQPPRKEADATLKNARFHGGQVSGFIYGDKKGRFHDGDFITTSLVKDVEVTTKNSRYVVELKEGE